MLLARRSPLRFQKDTSPCTLCIYNQIKSNQIHEKISLPFIHHTTPRRRRRARQMCLPQMVPFRTRTGTRIIVVGHGINGATRNTLDPLRVTSIFQSERDKSPSTRGQPVAEATKATCGRMDGCRVCAETDAPFWRVVEQELVARRARQASCLLTIHACKQNK